MKPKNVADLIGEIKYTNVNVELSRTLNHFYKLRQILGTEAQIIQIKNKDLNRSLQGMRDITQVSVSLSQHSNQNKISAYPQNFELSEALINELEQNMSLSSYMMRDDQRAAGQDRDKEFGENLQLARTASCFLYKVITENKNPDFSDVCNQCIRDVKKIKQDVLKIRNEISDNIDRMDEIDRMYNAGIMRNVISNRPLTETETADLRNNIDNRYLYVKQPLVNNRNELAKQLMRYQDELKVAETKRDVVHELNKYCAKPYQYMCGFTHMIGGCQISITEYGTIGLLYTDNNKNIQENYGEVERAHVENLSKLTCAALATLNNCNEANYKKLNKTTANYHRHNDAMLVKKTTELLGFLDAYDMPLEKVMAINEPRRAMKAENSYVQRLADARQKNSNSSYLG